MPTYFLFIVQERPKNQVFSSFFNLIGIWLALKWLVLGLLWGFHKIIKGLISFIIEVVFILKFKVIDLKVVNFWQQNVYKIWVLSFSNEILIEIFIRILVQSFFNWKELLLFFCNNLFKFLFLIIEKKTFF